MHFSHCELIFHTLTVYAQHAGNVQNIRKSVCVASIFIAPLHSDTYLTFSVALSIVIYV